MEARSMKKQKDKPKFYPVHPKLYPVIKAFHDIWMKGKCRCEYCEAKTN